MTQRKQTNIGLDREHYNRLNEKKSAVEQIIGRRLTWGTFLLILAGLKSVDELISHGQENVVELHEGESAPELDESESFFLPTTEEVVDIVRREADRIIRELKGGKG